MQQSPIPSKFGVEQQKYAVLAAAIEYLTTGTLPLDNMSGARQLVARSSELALVDGILYHLGSSLHPKLASSRAFAADAWRIDGWSFLRPPIISFLVLFVVVGTGMQWNLQPVCRVSHIRPWSPTRSFPSPTNPSAETLQIWRIGIMELRVTKKGNHYVVVLQDLFTKCPLVFSTPDQKSPRLVSLIVDELIPVFVVPEAILSDWGANLLSHLMMDILSCWVIQKLNTTAYHPQCNRIVEQFSRTLKGMLRAHAARFGNQWDLMLRGLLFAYWDTLHESTGEKPSFLAFRVHPRTPPEAAWMSSAPLLPTDLSDYRKQLIGFSIQCPGTSSYSDSSCSMPVQVLL